MNAELTGRVPMLVWLLVVAACTIVIIVRVAVTAAPVETPPLKVVSVGRIPAAAAAVWLTVPLVVVALIVFWSARRLL